MRTCFVSGDEASSDLLDEQPKPTKRKVSGDEGD
jgi:hypothetical protein